jgi:Tfp pilus assembly protein PilF
MGLFAEARERFEDVVRLDPGFADAHFNLAMTLSHRGEIGLAKLHLQKAIELNPANAEFYRQHLPLP